MNPIYTAESLNGKLISELKAIARTIGATVEGDLRKKATWVKAIVAHQVARIESVASNLVEELVGEIDSVADAAQAAVYECNSEAHARLEGQLLDLQVLMADIQTQLSLDISAIRTTIAEIDRVLPPAQIWWWDNQHGTVEIDGEKRQFKAVKMYGEPVVEIQSMSGTWINSQWNTAKNNKYINAVLKAIPDRISEVHDRILNSPIQENDNEIWDGNDFIGYSEDQPPGRGDGRGGRIEAEIWDEF